MELTDKIHLLKIDFEITLSPAKKIPRFVNVILIFGDKITLIDTGVKGSEEKIFSYIAQNNRKPSEIETVILSHSHPDHIGSAARIKELAGCKVLAHQNEAEWIENIDVQNRERPVPGFYNLVERSTAIDDKLTDGQIFNANPDVTLKCIHAPGHSRGSLNLLFLEDKILFTADSIPVMNDIPNYDDYSDLINSLNKIRAASFEKLLTSWTPPLIDPADIEHAIEEGSEYMKRIDGIVKETYKGEEKHRLEFCSLALEKLRLPPFLATAVVDRAFRSHLKNRN